MIQPSLRDLSDRHPKPGVETPGYSQISLRESPGGERAPWREGCRVEWRSLKMMRHLGVIHRYGIK